MKVTTQDIIKMLPFEAEFKHKMLSEWDSYSDDQRFNLEGIIWDTYADLYQNRLETNTELAIRDLSKGEEKLDEEFGKRVREKTDKEFDEMFKQNVPEVTLVETRDKLQEIMESVQNIADELHEENENKDSDASS